MGTQAKRSDIKPLLISRPDTARLLGNVHVSKLTRLEADGILIPRRLNPKSPTSHCFYGMDNVEAIAERHYRAMAARARTATVADREAAKAHQPQATEGGKT